MILSIGETFTLSWQQYKQRALPILAVIMISAAITGGLIMILALCTVFGAPLLAHLINEQTALFIIITLCCLLVLIVSVLAIWCQAATLAIVVDEELGIIEAFQTGWDYLWPMAWVMTILSGILITGFLYIIPVAFFLIWFSSTVYTVAIQDRGVLDILLACLEFIIAYPPAALLIAFLYFLPGILFLVWFSFCFYALFDEGHRGLEALLASKKYIKGHWWNTLGKLLLVWTISVLISLAPFVGQILSMLFVPFFMLFMLIMYRDLKSIKGEVILTENSGGRIFWWIVAALGLLLPLLVLAAVLFALLTGDQQWIEQMPQSMGELRI